MVLRAVFALTFVLFTSNAVPSTAGTPPGGWRTAALSDHPLVGRIWSTAQSAFTDASAVMEAARRARFVLLGEKHDNPDHHRLQAWIVEQTAGSGDTVVFEMLSTDEAGALNRAWQGDGTDLAALGPALRWEARGWFTWDDYKPIFAAAAKAGATPTVGDLPRSVRRAVSRSYEVLGDGVASRWALDRPLAEADRDVLARHILDGHCGLLPEQALIPVINVQRARDAALADSMIVAPEPSGRRYLIAGGGHARPDYGVPWYLRERGIADSDIVIVTMVEVEEDTDVPLESVLPTAADGIPSDYLWFTPRVDTLDPCAKYADQLKALKAHGKKPAAD